MDQSSDIVHIILIDRISGISFFQHLIYDVFQESFLVKSHHSGSVCHNITGLDVIKRNDILNHLCLVFFYDALFMSLIHNRNDLFLCNSFLLFSKRYPKNTGSNTRKPGNCQSKRPHYCYHYADKPHITERILSGAVISDPSEHQNAKRGKKNNTENRYQYQSRKLIYVTM